MFRFIIWDFGGTLFDSYPISTIALRQALSERGIDENYGEIMERLKISRRHALGHYMEKYGIDPGLERSFLIYEEQLFHLQRPNEFVREVCELVMEMNGGNFIYSHREGTAIKRILELNGMEKYFKLVVGKELAIERKPAPDGLIYILKRFSIDPYETLSVGDRSIDVEAARSAGIKACHFNEKGRGNPGAKYNITSFRELYNILREKVGG